MKKLFVMFSLLIIASISYHIKAQTHLISFTGTGASTSVSIVKVENLKTGETLTLNGYDTLRLTGNVGISQLLDHYSSELMIYPNPVNDNSIVEFFPHSAGDAIITLYEMTGKPITQIRSYLENSIQKYNLSGLNGGIYLITVSGNGFQFSGKIICNGQSDGNLKIEKVNSPDEPFSERDIKKEYYKTHGVVDMPYSSGERLKFTAISDNYTTIKTYTPLKDTSLTFKFISCLDGDNNNYPVVEIGNQTWMEENLKTTKYNNEEPIPVIQDSVEWYSLSTPAYCWYNNDEEANKANYGALYNRYAVYSGILCPAGWHVPTDNEWKTLEMHLGMNQEEADGIGWRGLFQGAELKSTPGWNQYMNGTNATGFNGFPAGYRSYYGSFIDIGKTCFWWSAVDSESGGPLWPRKLVYYESSVYRGGYDWGFGFSIRCVRDDGKPVVTTDTISAIYSYSAECGGNVTNEGETPVIARGVCWSIEENPTIINSHTTDGAGEGKFTSILNGLEPKQTYYIRAYATNSLGTVYGIQITFKTFPLFPTVSTNPVSNITPTSVLSGGSVISSGDSEVTARGVCWSSIHTPTISDSLTMDSTGIGAFTSSISLLEPNHKYFLRAYATNSLGTAYGNEVIFTTYNRLITDIEGNSYYTLIISDQEWLVENLKTTKYNDGSDIPLVEDATAWASLSTPGYCWYNNDEFPNKSVYGALYNWETVLTEKLCPTGWHVPRTEEWTNLADYLGGENIAGGKLKEVGYTHWYPTNNGATNETSFTALPGGYRYEDGAFENNGYDGLWWSSPEDGTDFCGQSYMSYSDVGVIISNGIKNKGGCSVRCMRDILAITTVNVTDVSSTTAKSGGYKIRDGGAPVTARGVCWSSLHSPTILDSLTSDGTGTGEFTSILSGLQKNLTYRLRAYATNSLGTAYGNEVYFSTRGDTGTIKDIEGNLYPTIEIGTQTWMAENLKSTRFNDSAEIPIVTDAAAWKALSTPGYCWYSNNETLGLNTYGALYNWYAVKTGKICPTGWHVPGNIEWNVLGDYLGGTDVAGGKLKEQGVDHWYSPNTDATNLSGFKGLPGGSRSELGTPFFNVGKIGYWWTSTEMDPGVAYFRVLFYNISVFDAFGKDDRWGLSVRCIKD